MDYQNQNQQGTPVYVPATQADMSVGDWIITMILMAIPIVNIIMLIIWAFDSTDIKKSRKTWAIAQLIVSVIFTVLGIISLVVFGSAIAYVLGSAF